MGQVVDRTSFTRRDRQRYRIKVQRCLDTLDLMLREYPFADSEPMTGVEIEFNLVDADLCPSLNGRDVLETINAEEFQTELGRWNLELNLPPRPLPGDQWRQLEHELLDLLAGAGAKAGDLRTQLIMIGILPTLRSDHMVAESITPDDRYYALNDQLLSARGEPVHIEINGTGSGEHLSEDFETIIPEAACTSLQLHLQVAPVDFGRYWNAAQCLAGVQLGVGANSPFLLGSQLWAETRIPLFEQACDVRTPELRNQGVRPRVWFGERWIDSVLDLFSENARYFPALVPLTSEIDPMSQLREDGAPALPELTLHNGTIWRWNRPIYDISDSTPHVRLENRVLPAGPTTVDMVANALFFYGLLRSLVEADHQLWRSVSFEAAAENFVTAAQARDERAALLARHRLDAAGRAGAAQAAPDGPRRSVPVGGQRRGPRPLPDGDRAPLRHAADRLVLAGGHGGRAGGARRGPREGAARDGRALPGGVHGEPAGAHLGDPELIQARLRARSPSRTAGYDRPPGTPRCS